MKIRSRLKKGGEPGSLSISRRNVDLDMSASLPNRMVYVVSKGDMGRKIFIHILEIMILKKVSFFSRMSWNLVLT